MPAITKLAARFSGIVAFSDNSVGSFHTQGEGWEDNYVLWSQDKVHSIADLAQVSWYEDVAHSYPYWRAVITAMETLSWIDFDWDTVVPAVQKSIRGMTGRFDLVVAFDDNTWATAAVVGEGSGGTFGMVVTADDPKIAAASNIAVVRNGLEQILLEIMSTCTITAP